MNFYTYAAAVGAGISIIWVAWLFAARATLRRRQLRPGYVLSIIQVVLVLALMYAGFKVSNYFLAIVGRTGVADTMLFRRIWIAIWALAMIASIQVFLDIRRMATAGPVSRPSPARRPPPAAKRTRPRR